MAAILRAGVLVALLIGLLFVDPPRVEAQSVINLSRDLVTLGIGSQNLTPDQPQLDATPLFQAAIDYAGAHHVPRVTLDPGAYYFLTTASPIAVIDINGLSDLTIDLAGSTVWFKEPRTQGFSINRCTRVTLQNFVIDYLNLPFTQVQLTSVDPAGRRLLYATLPGWPDPMRFNDADGGFGLPKMWAVAFRNGTIVPGTSRMGVVRPLAPGVIVLTADSAPWTQPGTLSTLRAGDVIAVTLRDGPDEPIQVFQSDSIVIANGSIYASAASAVQLAYVSNSVVDHVRLMSRPGSDHLVSSTSDGIHFVDGFQNNAIRNSLVMGALDDGFVMDSQYVAYVTAQLGPRQVRVTRLFFTAFPNGTPVNFVDATTAVETPAGTIVDQSPPDTSSPVFNGEVDITLDRDVVVQPGSALAYGSDPLRGIGSVIEDNTAVELLGHGIWIGGNHGVIIRRNVIDTTSAGGISIESAGPTCNQWPQSDSLVIDSNVVRNAPGPVTGAAGTQSALGGVEILNMYQQFAISPYPAHTNLAVTNNFITDAGRTGIWIGELNGGLVQNNFVTRWNRQPALPIFGMTVADAQLVQQDFPKPLALHFSTGVQLISNTFVSDSPFAQAVALSPASASVAMTAFAGVLAVSPNLPNFNWKAISDSSWLSIIGVASGTGAGTISYAVTVNNSGVPRSGTLTVAGVMFQVTQSAAAISGPTITQHPGRVLVGAGQTAHFSVAAALDPNLHYRWQASADNDNTWLDLTDTTPYGGTATATLTVAATTSSLTGLRFRCNVSNASGSVASLSAQLIVSVPPVVIVDRSTFTFGAVRSGNSFLAVTAAQHVRLTQAGLGAVSWTATPNVPWIQISPASGAGDAALDVSVHFDPSVPLLGTINGSIMLQVTGGANAPNPLTVVLNIQSFGASAPPFGSFDTPVDGGTGIAGSIPVTGWALDDVGVTRVTVCRDPLSGEAGADPMDCGGAGKMYIGDATFVDGARPDVQAANPSVPQSSRGGWGYLMLTNFLPGLGNGTFTLYAYAYDADGHTTPLGTKVITCNNAGSIAPFGAIDTPGQGQTVSGVVGNFGWVLSPGSAATPRFADPPDGGSVSVLVDGVDVGTPPLANWTSRSDLTELFPAAQYPGVNRALGLFGLDTTTLTNGVHTIAWVVNGTAGGSAGVGSRFLTVSNGGLSLDPGVGVVRASSNVIAQSRQLDVPLDAMARLGAHAQLASEIDAAPADASTIVGRRGFDLSRALQAYASSNGRTDVHSEEMDRIEVKLSGTSGHRYSGYLRSPDGLKPLPIGSTLDASTGAFVWMPGVGFYGSYDLVFVRWSRGRAVARQDVRVTLNAKGSNQVGPQTIIDLPSSGQPVGAAFYVGGWAADLDADVDTGVATVHVWAYPIDATGTRRDPIFVGPAVYGGERPDVAAVYGDRFGTSGYGIIVNSLPPGTYDIAVFAYSTVVNHFTPAKLIRVTVR